MQTNIAERYSSDPKVQAAENILRKCVHCGFCLATCPTYNILGDELDSPRGRIYQIKQVLEGETPTTEVRTHLDRCLTCRNCETTCPSGVEYGRLLDVGRHVVEEQTTRPWHELWLRSLVKNVLPYPSRIGPLIRIGQFFRPVLPERLAASVPPVHAVMPEQTPSLSNRAAQRTMLLLDGCVQPSMAPAINKAAIRVLERLGITLLDGNSVCCGAIHHHLNDTPEALDFVRRNIDLWWPLIEQGAEAIVITASGCGSMVKDYGELLADDAEYAEKAARVSALTADLSEVVADVATTIAADDVAGGLCRKLYGRDRIDTRHLQALTDSRRVALEDKTAATVARESQQSSFKVAFHPPCSLQHGQKLAGKVEKLLGNVGLELVQIDDSQECCGSAGTYSIFQPKLSTTLKAKKLSNIHKAAPSVIVSANIGCQLHLQSASKVPVMHWIELLDAALPLEMP